MFKLRVQPAVFLLLFFIHTHAIFAGIAHNTVTKGAMQANLHLGTQMVGYNALVTLSEMVPEFRELLGSIPTRSSFQVADIGTSHGYTLPLFSIMTNNPLGGIDSKLINQITVDHYDINASFYAESRQFIERNLPHMFERCTWTTRDMTTPPEDKKVNFLFMGHPNVMNYSVSFTDGEGVRQSYQDKSDWHQIICSNLRHHLADEGDAAFFFQSATELEQTMEWIVALNTTDSESQYSIAFEGEIDHKSGVTIPVFKYAIFVQKKPRDFSFLPDISVDSDAEEIVE